MKKILSVLILLAFVVGCNNSSANNLKDDEVYLFYSEACSHCHDAMAYIKQNYPSLKINKVDVATKNGRDLIFKCAEKHNLGNRIGTPLFCMGNNYIMGWGPTNEAKFDRYIKSYIKK